MRGSGGGSWLEQAVWRAAARLDAAFVGGTAAGRAVAARRLAGLGEGLTPAGDDYLLGAFHALWALDHPLRREAPALAELAAARTTSHSAAWLRAAAGGSVSPPWARLLLALAAASDAAVAPSAAAVAATGHSSGRWSLRGFCVLARCLAAAPPIALEAR
ncbi:MAG TPA: DUF2877 domain-containing protein [Thermoanaerobaculia bacterium]|nr:DUF2877 domain-containing protein [Thermoanaerobaculia bacterium]